MKQIKNKPQDDKKFYVYVFDLEDISTVPRWNGAMVSFASLNPLTALSSIALGATVNQRIGNLIFVKKIVFHFIVDYYAESNETLMPV